MLNVTIFRHGCFRDRPRRLFCCWPPEALAPTPRACPQFEPRPSFLNLKFCREPGFELIHHLFCISQRVFRLQCLGLAYTLVQHIINNLLPNDFANLLDMVGADRLCVRFGFHLRNQFGCRLLAPSMTSPRKFSFLPLLLLGEGSTRRFAIVAVLHLLLSLAVEERTRTVVPPLVQFCLLC